ncbi:MAG: hypothetical protein ACOZNI_03695 [Myxococcota bacterium]
MFWFLFVRAALADTMWAVEPAQGVRWPEVAAVTVTLAAGDEVEVLARRGDLARVRKGTDFGWVAAKSLGADAPAVVPADATLPEGELPPFRVEPATP